MSPEEQNIREQIAAGNMDHQPSGDNAKHLCLVIDSLRRQLGEARKDSGRLILVAHGCHDYNGGHRGTDAETFHHGIQTVINALDAALKKDPNDTQVNALAAIGRAAIDAARASQHSGEG